MDLKDEIAYLEYGKKFSELSEGQKMEVEYEYNDLVERGYLSLSLFILARISGLSCSYIVFIYLLSY